MKNSNTSNVNNKALNDRAHEKEMKRIEKAQRQAYFRKNEEELVKYIKKLDVSDKVNYHLLSKALPGTPDRIIKLTKQYKDKEYRRVKRKYSYYFK